MVVFAVYVLSPDNVLDAEKAFVTLNLINILNWPMTDLPMFITFVAQVSIEKKFKCKWSKNLNFAVLAYGSRVVSFFSSPKKKTCFLLERYLNDYLNNQC